MRNREKLGGCLFLCLLLRVNPGFTSSGGKLLWLVTTAWAVLDFSDTSSAWKFYLKCQHLGLTKHCAL